MRTCSACGKTEGDDVAFAEDDADTCDACIALADDKADDLPVVTIEGIQILAAGGPFFGQGSPKEGDFFTVDDLQAYADNTNALIAAGELTSPNKIGHDPEQKLLKLSGLTKGEEPAAGWLGNLRVDGDKLLADASDVPKKLAQLIKAKAFRKRSVELSSVAPQTKEGKKLGKRVKVIRALSWLGAQAPAVRTLDDIIALYHGDVSAAQLLADDVLDKDTHTVEFSDDFAAGDVVWSTSDGYMAKMDAVRRALNPGPNDYRYWVSDVADDKALVGESGSSESMWIVPFTTSGDGVTISPSSDWTLAQKEWVEAAESAYAQLFGGADDTRPRMTPKPVKPSKDTKPELTDEQVTSLAEAFGIDETDDAKRREQVVAKMGEFTPEPVKPAVDDKPVADDDKPVDDKPVVQPEPQMSAAEVEVLKAQAAKGEQAFEERRVERIKGRLDSAVEQGRLDPDKRPVWEKAFDDNEEQAATLLSQLPVDEELLAVYGVDDDGADPETRERTEDAQYAQYAAQMGIENPVTLKRGDS